MTKAPAAAPAGYTAYATTYPTGTNRWIERDGDLSLASDGLAMSFSFWLNFGAAGDGAWQRLFGDVTDALTLSKTSADVIRLQCYGTDADQKVRIETVATITSASGWTWFGISVDNATGGSAARVYYANAGTSWVATSSLEQIDYNQDGVNLDRTFADWAVGTFVGGGSQYFDGCISEFYFTYTYLDFSSATVRDNFYNSTTHKPAGDLSSYNSPIVYLKGAYDGWTANSGSGGNFEYKGAGSFTSCTAP